MSTTITANAVSNALLSPATPRCMQAAWISLFIIARIQEIDNALQNLQTQQHILLGQKSECSRFLHALRAPAENLNEQKALA